ncbi:MAG: restriction endonuclease-like protein [Muribaculaceae bacterium]|nr:restriction endonuclease-like protein [Muribaculaceae bacterium]
MDVLSFKSHEDKVIITATTAADMDKCWERFRSRVKDNADSYCDYCSSISGTLSLANPDHSHSLEKVTDTPGREWLKLPPVFYETAVYNVSIQFNDIDDEPVILHKLKRVTELFSRIKLGPKRWLLTAPLSFVNEPGIFELTFRYKPCEKPERTDKFIFRVVSPKLDTKSDYNLILAEINAQYNRIIYQYLTLTLQNLQSGGRSDNDVVWLSIFRSIAGEYEKWVRYIVNKPHLRQSHQIRHDRADRIKLWAPQMAERFAQVKAEGRLEREHFHHREIIHTHNTRENRFVKFTLDRISKRLTAIVEIIRDRNSRAKKADKVAESELTELDRLATSLQRLRHSSLMRGLKGEPLRSESMVLQKRTGYAQVYRNWLILQKGIDFFEGSNAIGMRPLWELYELWCFLKIRLMVASILGLHFDNHEITESRVPMIQPFEDNSREHIVVYNCADGSKVKLHYQHTYNRSSGTVHTATTENRPDIVLTIIKPDSFELTYLFDAKYRLRDDNHLNQEDRNEPDISSEGADTPPADAINQMHRYRDAIYFGSNKHSHSSKEIIGGYIIFPGRGNNDSVRQRYFYKSIETINIGAFPLLPDASDKANEGSLLYEFLSTILLTPHAYDHIKDSIPQKGLQYESTFEPSEEDIVLVGYYKTEQWDLIVSNRLYYVPAALDKGSINLVSGFERTKYLLLHHHNNRLMVRLTGGGPKFYPREALEALGFKPGGKYYLGFEIKDFTPVAGIDPRDYDLERKGKHSTSPYFTNLKSIKKNILSGPPPQL